MRPPATLTLLRSLRRLIGAGLWWFIVAHIPAYSGPPSRHERDPVAPDRAAGLQ